MQKKQELQTNNSQNQELQGELNPSSYTHEAFFRYWKTNREKCRWVTISDTPDVEEKAKSQGAAFLTWAAVNRDPHGNSEPTRRGFFPLDFDSAESVELTVKEARQVMDFLKDTFGVDLSCLRYFISGKKGIHIEIPSEVLGVKPTPKLHLYYKLIANYLIEVLALGTLDLSIYKGGKGSMWRLSNIQRDNGRYKIPITPFELRHKDVDDLISLTEEPRYLNKDQKPTEPKFAKAFQELLIELRQKKTTSPQKNNHSEGNQKKSQPNECMELLKNIEFFLNSENQEVWATYWMEDHWESVAANSRRFKTYFIHHYYETYGRTLNSAIFQEALTVIEGETQKRRISYPVHTRIGFDEDAVLIDLCDQKCQHIKITKEGYEIRNTKDAKFRRTERMKPLPLPEQGGNLNEMRQLLNMSNEDFVLAMGWLVGTLNPFGSYPILLLQGEQGTGKSTQAKLLRSVVDPATPLIRSAPQDERDLIIAAQNERIVGFDNLSRISLGLSDALCRLATGAGFITRKLYTDDEEKAFTAARPVLLNGINQVVERNDLLDRCVICHLSYISDNQRITDSDIWDKFEKIHPRILTTLCRAVQAALSWVHDVELEELPRMAEFAKWVTAAETDMPWESGLFTSLYMSNRSMAIQNSVEMDPVSAAILEYLGESVTEWRGTANELLGVLNNRVPETIQKTKQWPKAPNALSRRLNEIQTSLRHVGIDLSKDMQGTQKILCLKKIKENTDKTENTEKSLEKNDVPPTDTDIATNSIIDNGRNSTNVIKESEDLSF